jgi:hypothetical protein
MTKIEKFDLHLTQLILKSKNLKYDSGEVVVGRLTENITFSTKNPLDLKVNNEFPFECKISINSIQKFDLQYIHRINNSPFYISYLSNDDFNLKIIDFYDWQQHTSIYRLFLFKKVNYESINDILKINFNLDKRLHDISGNQIKINDVTFKISDDFKVSNNNASTEISTASDTFFFAVNLQYGNNLISTITLDMVIKKFHKLHATCKSNHISNYFITKSLNAEKELDELWNVQKYILPDLNYDKQIQENENQTEISKYWINNFYKYFSIDHELKCTFEDEVKRFSDILDYLPSKIDLLKSLKEFDVNNNELSNNVQKWWDAYSLPLFENVFSYKCTEVPEEVFTIYFLAIGLKLPWASILYEKIESAISPNLPSPLHSFLFLLAFFYKRLYINITNEGNSIYSDGYFWDNNYKSIINSEKKTKFEITKFSNDSYTNLNIGSDKSFKINQLCKIILENNNNKISIQPFLNEANNKLKFLNHLLIDIEGYTIDLSLVWQNGFIEFNNVRFKWILKKNRFQFTIHSPKKKNIKLNNKTIELNPIKKTIYYFEVSPTQPQFYLNLFNNQGGALFSNLPDKTSTAIITGFATTKFGTINQNILYSTDSGKHLLFGKNNDISKIQLNKKVDFLRFFVKYASGSSEIQYFKNTFIDKFLHLNNQNKINLLLLVDKKFVKNLKVFLSFFKHNFGFQPEYILNNKESNIQINSNLIIEFLYNNQVNAKEGINFKDNKHLILIGNSAEILVSNLIDLFKKYIKN